MTKQIKISEKDFIRIIFEESDIEISIRYNKRSTLKKRYEMIDKLKKVLLKV